MEITETALPGVKLLCQRRFSDDRGWFAEVYNSRHFHSAGLSETFVQDNHSSSRKGVLRGLHYQLGRPQGKLIRVLSGHIWDVAVDLRQDSEHFGNWIGFHLKPATDEGELRMLWIPKGFAHGFLVLSDVAEVLYKTTDYYHPSGERSVLWSDPTLSINWPLEELGGIEPALSPKDAAGSLLRDSELPQLL